MRSFDILLWHHPITSRGVWSRQLQRCCTDSATRHLYLRAISSSRQAKQRCHLVTKSTEGSEVRKVGWPMKWVSRVFVTLALTVTARSLSLAQGNAGTLRY